MVLEETAVDGFGYLGFLRHSEFKTYVSSDKSVVGISKFKTTIRATVIMPRGLNSIVITMSRATALSCWVVRCVGYRLSWHDWRILTNVVVPAVFGIEVDIVVDSV